MEMKVNSFINAAITNGCVANSSFAKATRLVEDRNEPHFANRIGGAWAALVIDRNGLRILDLEDNGTRVKDMPIKPEMFLSLCQYLMNQACWAARRYIKAQQQNAEQEALTTVSGIDFSQDVAADLGIEPMDHEAVEKTMDEDFKAMLRLHNMLSKHMNYLPNIEDLYMYAEREQEGENWRITGSAMCFEDALSLMDEVINKLREREDKALVSDMTTTDFSE